MTDKQETLNRILSYKRWRHRVPLGDGFRTMGYNTLDHDWSFYGMPEQLAGKTVLDIGANDGYYSFGAESRGAAAVTAIDIYGGDGANMVDGWPAEGISLLKDYLESRVEIIPMSVTDIGKLGKYWDVVFCNDVLSWLDDAPAAIELISRHCKETLVLRDTFLKSGVDQQGDGRGKVRRLALDNVVKRLKELGFKRVTVRPIRVFRHYLWQTEHFPGAWTTQPVKVYKSPAEPEVTGECLPSGDWILGLRDGFTYIKGVGWVKESDIVIRPRTSKNPVWSLLRQILPDSLLDRYYSRYNTEKNTGEFTITASR